MIPSNVILDAVPTLLADDTATLASVTANKLVLVASPFTPGPDLDISGLTLATFTGSTPVDAGTGNQTVFVDVQTGYRTVQIKEPAGGWTFICTADPTVPETIYGWIFVDNAGTVLLGAALLDAPVTISVAGQGITVPRLTFQFPPTSPF